MGTESQGVGKSKKAAEQDAARQALFLISSP
jgi:dsRNA-specific ribonuclease